jgi:hypothetical protein
VACGGRDRDRPNKEINIVNTEDRPLTGKRNDASRQRCIYCIRQGEVSLSVAPDPCLPAVMVTLTFPNGVEMGWELTREYCVGYRVRRVDGDGKEHQARVNGCGCEASGSPHVPQSDTDGAMCMWWLLAADLKCRFGILRTSIGG